MCTTVSGGRSVMFFIIGVVVWFLIEWGTLEIGKFHKPESSSSFWNATWRRRQKLRQLSQCISDHLHFSLGGAEEDDEGVPLSVVVADVAVVVDFEPLLLN